MKKGWMLFALLLLISLACNLPGATATALPEDNLGAAFTAAAKTVSASLTGIPLSRTNTPMPESATATLTLTPIPFPTNGGTAIVPMISVSEPTNCRIGPGKVYDYVSALLVGKTAEVVARDPTGNYWYIRNPENPSGFCWLWGEYATVTGNTSTLPVFTPPPTPTPAPDFEVEFVDIDSCVGWYLRFKVINTGGPAFKSYKIEVTDQVTDVTLSTSSNDFEDQNGCLSGGIVDKLEAGHTVYIASGSFVVDPDNHKIKAEITLCTAEGLGGFCVTKNLSFKP
jgi:hypothetical protein